MASLASTIVHGELDTATRLLAEPSLHRVMTPRGLLLVGGSDAREQAGQEHAEGTTVLVGPASHVISILEVLLKEEGKKPRPCFILSGRFPDTEASAKARDASE